MTNTPLPEPESEQLAALVHTIGAVARKHSGSDHI
jgi:hypothetical protein